MSATSRLLARLARLNLGGGERLGEATTFVTVDHEIHHDLDHASAPLLAHAEV